MTALQKNQLSAIIPQAKAVDIDKFIDPLNTAMAEFRINTPQRIAAFIAQISVESQYLSRMAESTNYTHADVLKKVFSSVFRSIADAQNYISNPEKCANRIYADKYGNGDEQSGDGWRYRGRGLPGLTFKDNYAECGKAIGLDLINHPEMLEDPLQASRCGAWFFNTHGCNELADVNQFGAITKKFNPAFEAAAERLSFYIAGKKVLTEC